MNKPLQALVAQIDSRFEDRVIRCDIATGQVTLHIAAENLLEVAKTLRDDPDFAFEQLMDVCGMDYAAYGDVEWETRQASGTGFSRGVSADFEIEEEFEDGRFVVVYHLLSIARNQRLRLHVNAPGSPPLVPSVVDVWNSANWFEREAFDLFGILFDGHPDLRRILTDYGFIGHPFRKDFPLIGNVEVRYDPEQKRVVYQPVTIEERILVPRVIREDKRLGVVEKSEETGDA